MTRIRLQTSDFTKILISDENWNEINTICLLDTSWIQLLQLRLYAKVEQMFIMTVRTKELETLSLFRLG